MIDAGTFEVQYDEDRQQYFVRETLEGFSRYCGDLNEVLALIEEQIWKPDGD